MFRVFSLTHVLSNNNRAYSSILYFHSMFFISCDPTISLERLIQMQREGNQTPDLPYHTFIEPHSDGIRQAMPVSVLSHGRGTLFLFIDLLY